METSNFEIKVTKAKTDGQFVSKTVAFIRESQTLLRRNIEILKHLEPEGPEDKAAIAEYLGDPVVNPLLEKRSEEPAEVKALSEKDKGIAKDQRRPFEVASRQCQDLPCDAGWDLLLQGASC
jgi:hypothetical protein